MAFRRPSALENRSWSDLADRVPVFALLSLGSLALAIAVPRPALSPVLYGTAAGFIALLALAGGHGAVSRLRGLVLSPRLRAKLENAPGLAVLTDAQGSVLAANARANASGPRDTLLENTLSGIAADPKGALLRMRERVQDVAEFEETFGTLEKGLLVSVTRLSARRILWSISPQSLDPELALLSVTLGRAALNGPAARLLGRGTRPLSEIIRDLPVRQGAIHHMRRADGTEFEARLIEMQSAPNRAEIAVLPPSEIAHETEDAASSALAVPDLLSVLPVPMLKISEAGLLLEANKEARAILALDADALPPLFELVEGMGRPIADWLSDAAQGRGLLKPEIVRAVIPGQELYLQIALGRTVENGRTVLIGILNDATELKTLEAQFVQSQKMQAIGQLAGGVAHDFNNLLTAISGHCDLLLLRHEASDPDYADLIQISQNANRAASLVGQLLAFSRKQNLKPQALDLRDTMADLAHLLNRLIGERVQLDVNHAPGPQMIRADRRQLEQVIVNLVVNARDAMPDGGRIEVITRSEFLPEPVSRDQARLTSGEYVVIEVRDTGCGIPAEALSKIFEPFFSTKKTGEGTGLGLSTAYGIVKQTGGYIFVESALGEGTTFTLFFPATTLRDTAPVEPEKPSAVAPVPRTDASILLVEDEAPVRAFACRALRLRGYTVIEACDAEEAIKILEDTSLQIDLFVTDVIMPGMDGPTWVRKARKDRPGTGVVFMSGYAEEGRAEKQARIPNSVFLPKPFSLQQLTSLVQEQLS
ncbi:MAG: ATP-binding protein [Pseudomonadota bacterium]